MGKLLLTLDTLVPDRDYIEIKVGEVTHKIEMRTEEELSLKDLGYIVRTAKLFAPGFNLEASEDALRETAGFVDTILTIILVSPDPEVLARLTILQKTQILETFTQVGARKRGKAPTDEAENRPTGEESSPDSAGSTVVN